MTGGGRRLAAAVVLLPWVLGYGVTGVWAVTRAARAVSEHLHHIDAGYTRPVTPGQLIVVGALLLVAFAVTLAAAILLLAWSPRRGVWWAVLVAAALLVAGALWAGVMGHIHPGLWLLLFFGLLFAAVVAAAGLLRLPRQPPPATTVAP